MRFICKTRLCSTSTIMCMYNIHLKDKLLEYDRYNRTKAKRLSKFKLHWNNGSYYSWNEK